MIKKGNYNLSKKGCTFNVKNNFDNISISCETIDKVNFKSVILFMGSWFIVDTDYKSTRKMEKLLQQIKNTINLNMNKHYFNGMIIDVAEIPFTFDEQKTGYVSFEYTLFVNKGVKFNRQEITMVLNDLIDVIYNDYFKEPIDFNCYKTRVEFRSILND
jgi:hypothetical protein